MEIIRSYISRGSIPNCRGVGGGGEVEHDTEHTEILCNTQPADTQDNFWLTDVFHCSMSIVQYNLEAWHRTYRETFKYWIYKVHLQIYAYDCVIIQLNIEELEIYEPEHLFCPGTFYFHHQIPQV